MQLARRIYKEQAHAETPEPPPKELQTTSEDNRHDAGEQGTDWHVLPPVQRDVGVHGSLLWQWSSVDSRGTSLESFRALGQDY